MDLEHLQMFFNFLNVMVTAAFCHCYETLSGVIRTSIKISPFFSFLSFSLVVDQVAPGRIMIFEQSF